MIASGGSKTEVGAAMYRMLCYQTIYVRQEEVDGAVQASLSSPVSPISRRTFFLVGSRRDHARRLARVRRT